MIRAFILMLAACFAATAAHAAPDFDKLKGSLGSLRDLNRKADPAEERAIGQDAAATLLGASPLHPDARAQRYVNLVGRWVADQTKRTGLPWRFAVLDDPDINAYAAPGGYVFVTKGLLLELESEAELAGVLGHEITHVVRKHHLKALQKDQRIEFIKGKAVDRLADDDAERRARLEKIAQGAKTLYAKGLDKRDEFEADRMGLVLAARAGYEPYGLVAVLQALDAASPGSRRVELLFKSHPAPAERLAALDAALSGAGLDGLPNRREGRERFAAELAGLR
jgi:predicted Zn-dependent protease